MGSCIVMGPHGARRLIFPCHIYIYTYACNVSRCVFYTTATTATSNTKKSNPIPTPIQSNPIQIEIQSNPIQYIYIYIQSNPILSNPIQPNPIKSNPIQSNPVQCNPIQFQFQSNPTQSKFNRNFVSTKSKSISRFRGGYHKGELTPPTSDI